MYSRDLERMVRTLHRQRCDHAYIRHYLQENYLLTDAIINQIFAACGVGPKSKSSVVKISNEIMGGKKAEKPDENKINRSNYY